MATVRIVISTAGPQIICRILTITSQNGFGHTNGRPSRGHVMRSYNLDTRRNGPARAGERPWQARRDFFGARELADKPLARNSDHQWSIPFCKVTHRSEQL